MGHLKVNVKIHEGCKKYSQQKLLIYRLAVKYQRNYSIQPLPFQTTALIQRGVVAQISPKLSGMISSPSFFKALVRAATFLQLCNLGNIQSRFCNEKYKNVAALTCSLKKEWDGITPDKLCDICAAAPFRIKAVVQDGGGYIEQFFWSFTANL